MVRVLGGSDRDCDGVGRRRFLQVAAPGLAGLVRPEHFRLRTQEADRPEGSTFSVLMGCGPFCRGSVVGRNGERGGQVVNRPISPQDVATTVYDAPGIDSRAVRPEGRQARGP